MRGIFAPLVTKGMFIEQRLEIVERESNSGRILPRFKQQQEEGALVQQLQIKKKKYSNFTPLFSHHFSWPSLNPFSSFLYYHAFFSLRSANFLT